MADADTLAFMKMVAEEATVGARYWWDYYEAALASPTVEPEVVVPEGLVPLNLTPEELTDLAAICSYYKNTNAYPSSGCQRVAAKVIERHRGY